MPGKIERQMTRSFVFILLMVVMVAATFTASFFLSHLPATWSEVKKWFSFHGTTSGLFKSGNSSCNGETSVVRERGGKSLTLFFIAFDVNFHQQQQQQLGRT